jgi:hypothetical protein
LKHARNGDANGSPTVVLPVLERAPAVTPTEAEPNPHPVGPRAVAEVPVETHGADNRLPPQQLHSLEPTLGLRVAHYLSGIGLGLLPLLIASATLSTSSRLRESASPRGILAGFGLSGALWLAAIIAMVVLMTRQRLRFIGYGLLSVIVLLPVVGAVWLLLLMAAAQGG